MVSVGRIVFTKQALPAIQPVNFATHRRAVPEPDDRHVHIVATGEAALAERELLHPSARPPRRAVATGRWAFPHRQTRRAQPQEAAVAQLAQAGRTNREIAQQLHLSVKTVVTRLGHIFQKLGIRSRWQLAGRVSPNTEETVGNDLERRLRSASPAARCSSRYLFFGEGCPPSVRAPPRMVVAITMATATRTTSLRTYWPSRVGMWCGPANSRPASSTAGDRMPTS